jgi:hypothetical protein
MRTRHAECSQAQAALAFVSIKQPTFKSEILFILLRYDELFCYVAANSCMWDSGIHYQRDLRFGGR